VSDATLAGTPVARRDSVLRTFRAEWPLWIVLACFGLSACIVPTLTNVATTDDWGYSRSVEILVNDGRLMIFSVVAATAVGQVLWGALFAEIFSMTLGVMRLSTVVVTALGAAAFYDILRQLGITRGRAALGVAVHLFNPLSFMLAFTFMTDPHFVAWMLIACACYLRGLPREAVDWRWVLAGATAAAFAFLIRQQGALIPFAIGGWLLVTRRLRVDWRSGRLLALVGGIPALTLVAYYLSLRWIMPIILIQSAFLDEMLDYGLAGTIGQLEKLSFIATAYIGLLLVPIVLAILPRPGDLARMAIRAHRATWLVAIAATGLISLGAWVFTFGDRPRRMPYIAQFAGVRGLGPADVPGARVQLVEWAWIRDALTIAAVAGAIVAGVVLSLKLIAPADPVRAALGMLVAVFLGQWAGVFPPSFHYVERGGSLDRYLIPLFPFAIAFLLWAVRDVRLWTPLAWLAITAIGAFSTAGARDYLVYLSAVWDMGHHAQTIGADITQIDAGSGWDGYHMYTNGQEKKGTKVWSPEPAPWWIYLYARRIDSTYVVSTNPRKSGYVVVAREEYSQWLEDDPVYVYLLKQG
jgi:4-amino-4-deoxy-L-arabinose transferase-like glycosyltransferase